MKKNIITISLVALITLALLIIGSKFFNEMYIYIISFIPLLLVILVLLVDAKDKIKQKIIDSHENNFREFFESIKDMIIVMNLNGKILYANYSLCMQLGYAPDVILGKHILDIHYIVNSAEADIMFQEVINKKRDHCPLPLVSVDGAIIPVDTRIWNGIWYGESCTFCLSKNMTSEQLALDKFTNIFNNSTALMGMLSMKTEEIIDVNQAFLDKICYTREEIIGKKLADLDLFADNMYRDNLYNDFYKNYRINNADVSLKNKHGDTIYGLCSVEVIRTTNEDLLFVLFIDLTEQKRAQVALKEINEQYLLAINASNDGMWDWDLKSNTMYMSSRWKEMIGYREEEIENSVSSFFERIHPDDSIRVQRYIDDYLSGKQKVFEIEFRLRHKKGNYIWIQSKGAALYDNNGLPYRMAGSQADITARKAMENELIMKGRIFQTTLRLTQDLLDNNNYLEAIRRSLQHLGEAISVNRVFYYENHYDKSNNLIFTSQKSEWCSDEIYKQIDNPEISNIPVELLDQLINPLSKGITFRAVVSRLKDSYIKKLFSEQGIKSTIIVPIFVNNQFWGYIGLDDCEAERVWSDTELTLMSIFAISISKAIEKRRFQLELSKQEATNKAILSAIPDIMLMVTDDGTIINYRSGADQIEIFNRDTVLNQNVSEILPKHIAEKAMRTLKAVRLTGRLHVFEYSNEVNNLIHYYEARVVPCQEYTYLCSLRDITGRKMMEKALDDERNVLKTTLYSIGDGVISTDGQGRIKIINKIAEQLTGYSQEEAQGKHLDDIFVIVDEKTLKRAESPVEKVVESGEIIEFLNHRLLVSKDGTMRPIEDSAAPIYDEEMLTSGVVVVFRDFTEKRKRQEEVEYLSYHDHLTGLYNRTYYEQALKRLDKKNKLPLSIIMADVNGLKLTNDAFGHDKGDELLRRFATILLNNCTKREIIARIGGDEFVILLPKTDKLEAEKLVNKLNNTIQTIHADKVVMSVSFGFDTRLDLETKIADVFRNAEDSMYRSKLSESNSMRNRTISIIMKTLYEKNKIEEEHSKRVSKLSREIAVAMDMSDYDVHEMEVVGLMHDIGKIGIDLGILNMPGKLSGKDLNEMRKHSEIGYRILSSVADFSQIAKYVLAHHERWDGMGYPNGIKDVDIPIKSRIIAVADAYDAMTSERAYRKAQSKEYAISEIKNNAGLHFDPNIARVFIEKVLKEEW